MLGPSPTCSVSHLADEDISQPDSPGRGYAFPESSTESLFVRQDVEIKTESHDFSAVLASRRHPSWLNLARVNRGNSVVEVLKLVDLMRPIEG